LTWFNYSQVSSRDRGRYKHVFWFGAWVFYGLLIDATAHEVLWVARLPVREAYNHAIPALLRLGCPDLEPAHVADFVVVAGAVKVRHLISLRRVVFSRCGFWRRILNHFLNHFLTHQNAVFVCPENCHHTYLSQTAGPALDIAVIAGAVTGKAA
jgi:hypothetical protein